MWWKRKGSKEAANPQSTRAADGGAAAAGAAQLRFLDPETLSRISSLELLARAVVEGFISGLHRSPYTGFSTEFAEYRQYQPGDDLRYLDWRLLGRTDRYFIKKYRADTNTQCQLLLDTSASMRYGSGAVTKLQYAQFLAAALAHLVARQQDSVGLLTFDEEVRTQVPAHNRSGHLRTIFGRLSQIEAGGSTRLAGMLHQAAERFTRRGVIVLISDMYEDVAALKDAFQHLRYRGHDLIAFHVMDRNEIEFDFREPILLLEDVETEEQLPVLPDAVAGGYRRRINEHLENLRNMCAANRVDYELIRTDQPLDFALFSFLSRRARG